MLINVRLMVFFMRHNSLVVLYGWDYYVCIDAIFAFYGYVDFFYPSLLLSWMFEHDCLDPCCFGCLIIMQVFGVFLVLTLVQHV